MDELNGNKTVTDLEVTQTKMWRKDWTLNIERQGDTSHLSRRGCHLESRNRYPSSWVLSVPLEPLDVRAFCVLAGNEGLGPWPSRL